eukprot:CAMPEP_0174272610 /NCGR_PEP_ID=MMETSP0439-20130205/51855_1 /TAXON_ID=0 /ORGANISM="Stereomyxa ramosa, Strain Chinc5" /LENGTH=511 /DNA_ID=CAMNT_0015363289 /DNA_START=73 /DNA_END=1605 /DNA_ORIENTATION=+
MTKKKARGDSSGNSTVVVRNKTDIEKWAYNYLLKGGEALVGLWTGRRKHKMAAIYQDLKSHMAMETAGDQTSRTDDPKWKGVTVKENGNYETLTSKGNLGGYLAKPQVKTAGIILLTNYRVVFYADQRPAEEENAIDVGIEPTFDVVRDFSIPLASIFRLARHKNFKYMRIYCKDFRIVQFHCVDFVDPKKAMKRLYTKIKYHAFPKNQKLLFAFSYRPSWYETTTQNHTSGWGKLNIEDDFKRIGVGGKYPNWRLTLVNSNYEICSTYPAVIAVPTAVNDNTLTWVSSFRSRGRLPILSWIHPETQSSLTRASQPMVGLQNHTCGSDDILLYEIAKATPPSPPSSKSSLIILDARPKVNAAANRARGAGYENLAHLENFFNNYSMEETTESNENFTTKTTDTLTPNPNPVPSYETPKQKMQRLFSDSDLGEHLEEETITSPTSKVRSPLKSRLSERTEKVISKGRNTAHYVRKKTFSGALEETSKGIEKQESESQIGSVDGVEFESDVSI